jgi:hypothetical protein
VCVTLSGVGGLSDGEEVCDKGRGSMVCAL